MALPAAALAGAAVLEAAAVLNAAREVYFGGGAQYIRDGVPIGTIPALGQAIARQTCRRYADSGQDLPGDTAANYEKACRPYLDDIGYGEGPKLLKPFEGGQCDALYIFSYQGTTNNGAASYNVRGKTWGPLGGARSVDRGDGRFNVEVLSSGNIIATQLCSGSNPSKGEYIYRQANSSAGILGPDDGGTFSIQQACSGSDDCGNPPPDYTEPEPPPNPDPPTEPFNPDGDTNIDITVNLQPDSLIEVNLGFGPIVVPVFGGSGDDGGGGGETPTDPDTSPPNPEPGPELPGGNGGFGGDDGFGPPPAGRRWVCCCIRITDTPNNVSVIATSEPEDVYPAVIGNIRLVFDASGNRQTDTPVRILAKHVCVWEPVQKLNPVGVNVDLLPGYGYTFRPYSVPSGD